MKFSQNSAWANNEKILLLLNLNHCFTKNNITCETFIMKQKNKCRNK